MDSSNSDESIDRSDNVSQDMFLDLNETSGRKSFSCPLCQQSVKNLPRHLQSKKHNIRSPIKILSQNPFYKTAKPKVKKCCPMCNISINRVSQHLRRKHNLTGELLYSMSRQAKIKEFPETITEITSIKKQLFSEPDLQMPSTSSNSQDLLLITIDDYFLTNFTDHMNSLEGGSKSNAKEYTNNVANILKIVGNSIDDLMPDNVSNKYFNPIFQSCKAKIGVDGASFREKKPATLISYLYSFKSFINYLFLKFPDLKNTRMFSWNEILPQWLQTVRKEEKKYQSEKEQNKLRKSLSPSYYVKYLKSNEEVEKQMLEIDISELSSVNQTSFLDTFKLFRNHLVVRISVENANRPCVIQHFVMRDLDLGSHEEGSTIYHVSHHKTSSTYGAASLLISSEVMPIFNNYLEVRRTFQTFHPSCQSVFPTIKGTPLKAAHIRNILSKAFKQEGFSFQVSGNTLRQMAVTNVSEQAPTQRHVLAKHMGHSLRTAEAHYTLTSKRQNAIKCHKMLSQLYRLKDHTRQTAPESPAKDVVEKDVDDPQCEPSGSKDRKMKRVSWECRHLEKLKILFSEFIQAKKIPRLADVRLVLEKNQNFYKKIIQERAIDVNKQGDLSKLHYAVLSRIKTFL